MQTNIWTPDQRKLWPHARLDYIFIGTAITELGRTMFSDWEDEDPAADYLVPDPEPAEPSRHFGGRSMGIGAGPPQSFEVQYAEYQKKHADWKRRSAEIISHNERVFPAFHRSRAVFDLILYAVQQEGLMLVNPTARPHMMISIPPRFWDGADPYYCFSTGKACYPPQRGQSPMPSSGQDWIFVGRSDFAANPAISKALARRVAPMVIDQATVSPTSRVISKEQSETWYRERVAEARGQGIRYSRVEDERAGKALGISRNRVRDLRRIHAPDWTLRDGRPSK
ncbi:hypothetical protein [Sphingobium chlorophenolicum]|uniref:Uncharacterized protein n=1 Tax=Sphingobium chlorophenolicum TaxID=46429 RepID=A0A081RCZ6_SPHCR|nr:hypothetical protein [Sphingobium chlorophenolicum]KEQ53069.1 hypothetical protein BV95_02725 [Sphingobium chlorophenolicum]